MPITISGSTGIAGVDGSAATPAIQGTDTNTGVVFPAVDTVAIATNGTERLRVDSSGQVGIGTSSPDAPLTVNTIASFGDGAVTTPSIAHKGDLNTGLWFPAADTLAVSTNGLERVRVDSSGRSTFPYQPLFHVYGSTTQSWSGAAAYQTLAFNTSVTFSNHPSGWNTGTYTFTAPVAGTYLFIAKITQTGTATGPQGYLFVNGVATGTEMMISYSTAYLSSTGQQFLQLAANDAVTFRVINNNSTTFSLDLSRCSLTGILIG